MILDVSLYLIAAKLFSAAVTATVALRGFPMHHVVAIFAFLICYVVGFQIALAGPGNHDVFGWALLFGVAFAVPSLFFVGTSYLLFILIRWWATVLLSVAAIGIYLYASSLHSEG
jgi:hypothetical protein